MRTKCLQTAFRPYHKLIVEFRSVDSARLIDAYIDLEQQVTGSLHQSAIQCKYLFRNEKFSIKLLFDVQLDSFYSSTIQVCTAMHSMLTQAHRITQLSYTIYI